MRSPIACSSWQTYPQAQGTPTGRPAKAYVLPNTGPDPAKSLSHPKGSWPRVAHPQLHTEEPGRRVSSQQGTSSDNSEALNHPTGAFHLCVLGTWLPPVGVPAGGTPSPYPSAERFLEALRIRCLRSWQLGGSWCEHSNGKQVTWPQRAQSCTDP